MYRLLMGLLVIALPSPAFAWWEYGHETVAKIALAEVKPATRAKVQAMMRQGALLATPTCKIDTAEGLAYWPDCIKTLKDRFSYAYSWHYQNVDVCKPFDLKSACADGNCVSAQVTRNAKLLADKSLPMRERVMALAFLVHFVGDLHMPLHAGDRSDRGGNDLKMSYGAFAGSRLNIHSIWDGYLAERAISSPPDGAQGLTTEVRPGMADGSVEDWSRESWAVARDAAYGAALGDPCGPKPARATLDNAKIEALVPVVRLQVERGGMRLARLLDEALR
ncbi:S1/P1 nuclease [Sphingomonas sp. SUN039]|uniref:S1/P1 nuclease n=1 Tax=Sphingomonas sp. SUN039 TaxID=2937787 RepID=UPI0021643FE1|nr:S1/P1 nuclease [Sphingomonas sp. SUN039]UVO55552.1 S1/P1 nuclease [Sphingomonas sp. SUN039]